MQSSFTAPIESVKHLNYWDLLQLYSLQRRRERYAIHTWRVMEGQVPILHSQITIYWSTRYGRKCKIKPVISRGVKSTITHVIVISHSVNTRGPRLSNLLPTDIRNGHNWSYVITGHNGQLELLDQPSNVGLRATNHNSLTDQTCQRWLATDQAGS